MGVGCVIGLIIKQEITGPRFSEEEEEPPEEKVLSFGEKRKQLQK